VSLTRLATRGTIVLAGRRFEVSGQSWMDHEFGSGALGRDLAGWDWVSLNLDSGEDLMLYRLRRKDGTIEPASSGTWIGRDGKAEHLVLEAFELEATGAWTSPKSGGRYPSGWRVRVPSRGLDVTLTPLLEDQELVSKVTGITYWEGAVDAKGTRQGANIAGRGYVELTGYAGRRPDVGP
jgi:predicted secreted hydrolase